MSWIVDNTNPVFADRKKSARGKIESMEFPGLKDEEWKYTKLGKLSKKSFAIEQTSQAGLNNQNLFPGAKVRLVFENGFFRKDLSVGSSAYVKRVSEISEKELSEALSKTGYVKEGFLPTYNDAFFTDGVLVYIPANTIVEDVFEFVFISGGSSHAGVVKNIFICESDSKVQVVMNFIAEKANENLVNNVLHAAVHERAKLVIYKLQQEAAGVNHFSSENIFQHSDSVFEIHTVTLNGDLVRNDLSIKVDGTNCQTHLGGVFIANGKMHVDNHTTVDHQKPECESNEIYKGIADGTATGVFNGKIFVRRDAQKINAYQNSANILLSDDASIYTKPELEIYADDVKCSHGTTTGCLDETAMFYLRARGIGEDSARKLLIHAFASDMVEKIENDSVRDWILQKIDEKLESI